MKKKYIVRIPETIEHVVVIEATCASDALDNAYETVMNGHPETEFGDNYSTESLGTNGSRAYVTNYTEG